MGSSLRFLGHPCGACPGLRTPAGRPDLATTGRCRILPSPATNNSASPIVTICRVEDARCTLDFPWRCPPFPASCPFRSIMARRGLPPHRPHRAAFPQRVRQADSLPRLRDVLRIRGRYSVEFWVHSNRVLSLDYGSVDRYICSGNPFPPVASRGRPLREPCGSPPSSVVWVSTTAPDPSATPPVGVNPKNETAS